MQLLAESVSDKELINIHNSKLWKLYLTYKSLLKFNFFIKSNKNYETTFFKYIPGNFKKNYVLGICHDDWCGVKNATLNQCSDVISIHQFDKKTIKKIIFLIKKRKFDKIAINAIPDKTDQFLISLKKQLPNIKIYLIWHGSFTQQTIEDHICRFNSLYPHFNKIDKFGFVKDNMAEVFNRSGIKAEFIPNRINETPTYQNKNVNKIPKIGILSRFLWHKNNMNQIIAASLFSKKEIHTLEIPNILYLSKLINNDLISHQFLPHEKYKKILSEMDINLYISLTECYPMVFIESLMCGVPCLVGKTSEFIFDDQKELAKYLVVQNPEDIFEIEEKIKTVLKKYNTVIKLCNIFIQKLNKKNSQKIIKFFN